MKRMRVVERLRALVLAGAFTLLGAVPGWVAVSPAHAQNDEDYESVPYEDEEYEDEPEAEDYSRDLAREGRDGYSIQRLEREPIGRVEIDVWTDRGEGAVVRDGEPIRIFFRTTADAYVAIYDIDTEGTVRLLYPWGPEDEDFVQGGRTYSVPSPWAGYRFVARGPEGVEYIEGLASAYPIVDEWGDYFHQAGTTVDWYDDDQYWRRSGYIDGDPFVSMDRINRSLLPENCDDEYFAADYTSFYLMRRVPYPRYLIADWRVIGCDPYYDPYPRVIVNVDLSWHFHRHRRHHWFSAPYYVVRERTYPKHDLYYRSGSRVFRRDGGSGYRKPDRYVGSGDRYRDRDYRAPRTGGKTQGRSLDRRDVSERRKNRLPEERPNISRYERDPRERKITGRERQYNSRERKSNGRERQYNPAPVESRTKVYNESRKIERRDRKRGWQRPWGSEPKVQSRSTKPWKEYSDRKSSRVERSPGGNRGRGARENREAVKSREGSKKSREQHPEKSREGEKSKGHGKSSRERSRR